MRGRRCEEAECSRPPEGPFKVRLVGRGVVASREASLPTFIAFASKPMQGAWPPGAVLALAQSNGAVMHPNGATIFDVIAPSTPCEACQYTFPIIW